MSNKEQQLRYKGFRCASCGMSVDEMVSRFGTFKRMTEFHHINPETKSKNYKNIIRQSISSKQLDELDKCVLLCRQCHGIVHAQNINGHVELNLTLHKRLVKQKFEGQFVFDMVDKKLKFLTDKRILLFPYSIILGQGEEVVYFGMELDDGKFFSRILKNIKEYGTIVVLNTNTREILMKATVLDNDNIELKQNIKFPFFNYDLTDKSDSGTYLWIRNGMLMKKSGEISTKGIITCNIRLLDK